MNKNKIRIFAAALAAVTAAAGLHVAVSASADRAAETNMSVSTLSTALTEAAASEKTTEEDEAAYIFTDAAGAVKEVIVSDWLKDGSGDTYTQDEANAQVPVDMKISYTLDGREIQPAELAGRSGKVTMKFDFVNNEKRTAQINGKQEDIYVPFLMLSGMILDNEHFSNVKVENGKLVNDGSRQIVIDYALPGLQDSLALTSDQLEIPDSFTVSADVKDFELDMVLTFASSGLLDKLDTDSIDSLDDLKDALSRMTDAMDQLTDGASQLQSGLETLLEESGKLESGVNELADGAGQAAEGASKLADGAGSLTDGASQLYAGLSELSSNNSALNDGAARVFAALLNTAQTQIRASGQDIQDLTISNYSEVLDSLIRSLDDAGIYAQALAQVTAGVDAAGDEVYKKYLENNAESIIHAYLESMGESLYRQYVESIADDVYRQYIESNADQICMQYLTGNADAIYRKYIESVAESIYSDYALTQIPEEQKEAMTEEELAQAVTAIVSQLTDDQKAQILEGALAQLTDEQKAQILEEALAQLSAEERAQILEGALAQLTDEQKAQILEGALAQLSDDQKEQILAGAMAKLNDEQKAQILEGALTQLTDEQKAQIRQGAIDLLMASDEVQAQMKAAAESVQQLTGLKAQLDTFNQFYLGLQSYTAGVASAADGAGSLLAGSRELQSGAASLSNGSKQIADGCEELRSNIPALLDGITKLRDGSATLSDGLNEFKQEAIQKLTDAVDGDLDGMLDRLRAIHQAGKDYENAAQKDGSLAGAKLIYHMDAINK